MTSIETVVSKLTSPPLPILIADTCSLLDILRAPVRLDPGEVRAVMSFWFAITRQPQPTAALVLPEVIWKSEIDQRRSAAENDLRSFCNQYERAALSIKFWCDVVGAEKPPDPDGFTNGLIRSFGELFDGVTAAQNRRITPMH